MATVTPNRRSIAIAGLLVLAIAVGGALAAVRPWAGPSCAPPEHPEWSVARRWNEALLDAIRRDLPAPTVHARNLFHTAAAMWDAWAAYEPGASGYFVQEKAEASDRTAARNEAISYAAYRVLESRYAGAVGAVDSIIEFDRVMTSLCYSRDVTTTEGDSPAALGNRIAQTVLDFGMRDGSNEAEGYSDPDYAPVNEPLVVSRPGTAMTDPNRWQPLQLEKMVSQNGIPVANGSQEFIDPHWGAVAGFALPDQPAAAEMPMDPGEPPRLGTASAGAFKDDAVAVIRYSSLLDPGAGVTIDISPGSLGATRSGATTAPATRRTRPRARPTPPTLSITPTSAVPSPSSGRTARSRRRRRATGTRSPIRSPTRSVTSSGSAAAGRPSTGSSGTSSSISRSTRPTTTRRSRHGGSRTTTTPPGRSR